MSAKSNDFGMLLGRDFDDNEIWWDPSKEKNPHIVLIGETGTGKTQTSKALIHELKNRHLAEIIIDFHDEYKEFADRIIDVRNSSGLGINPLEVVEQGPIDTAYLIPEIFRRLGLVGGDQQQAYLRKAILLAFGIDQDRGMKKIIDSSSDKVPTFRDIRKKLEQLQNTSKHAAGIIPALMNRMGLVFDLQLFSNEGSIPFSELMNQTTVVSLKSLPNEGTRLVVADFFLRKLWNFVYKQGESKQLKLYCVADEAHRLAYDGSPVDTVLREARKYGVGIILASQSPHDFDRVVFGNAATKVCFRCPLDEDAVFMSKQLGCPAYQIQNLSKSFEAMVKLGSSESCQRIQIVPYYERVKPKEEAKPPIVSAVQASTTVQNNSEGKLSGQVSFGIEGRLEGESSLGSWTDENDSS